MTTSLEKKDPQAILDYGFDWTAWLATANPDDTISASTWAVTGSDAVLTTSASTHDGQTTTVWLTAGTLGVVYKVTNHVVTAGGRQDDRTLKVRVVDR